MSEPTMSWVDLLAWSDGHGLLGKRGVDALGEFPAGRDLARHGDGVRIDQR